MTHGIHHENPPNLALSDWIAGQFPPGYPGRAVDVGASDGISVNSTYGLEHGRGWTVLCVEPNPQFHERLSQCRALVQACACDVTPAERAEFKVHLEWAEAYSSLRPTTDHEKWKPSHDARWTTIVVQVKTMEQCLADAGFLRLDALCIDTEGTELDVLKSLDLARWLPRVIVVESWDEVGPHAEYLAGFGYQRKLRMEPVNDCFVREDA